MQNSERSIGFLDLQVKLMSSHQAEIQAARTLFTTIMASGKKDYILTAFFNSLVSFLLLNET